MFGKLIERFMANYGDRCCEARIYETTRKGGRRIVLVEGGSAIVFDSQDCFDLGNAMASMDRWMESQGIAIVF